MDVQTNLNYLRSVPSDALKAACGKETKKRKPVCLSLFTGAGGAALGIAMAGFDVRVMVEFEHSACETLRANWTHAAIQARIFRGKEGPDCGEGYAYELVTYPKWFKKTDREPVILERDIRTLSTAEILAAAECEVGEATLVEGGPPCQGFSTANSRRRVDDPRNDLFLQFVRIVRESLPVFVLFENVPGLASIDNGSVMKRVCLEFASCGYQVAWRILDAADYGVPQHRRRIILHAHRNDLMVFTEAGRVQLHMGVGAGPISVPQEWAKKYLCSCGNNHPAEGVEPIWQIQKSKE